MKAYKANPENFKGNVSDVAEVVRIAVTGRANTPDLWTIVHIMGEEMCIRDRYSSMSKLWLNCVKKCAWISIVFPLINSVVLTGCALSYPSVINCNWLEEGSVARNFIPNGNITTENTFVIILICFLLDILRVQITILTICAPVSYTHQKWTIL